MGGVTAATLWAGEPKLTRMRHSEVMLERGESKC